MKIFFSLLIMLLPIVANSQTQQSKTQQIDSVKKVNNNSDKEIVSLLELKREYLDDKQSYLNIFLVLSTIFITLSGVGLTLLINREHRSVKEKTKASFEGIEQKNKELDNAIKDKLQELDKEKEKIQKFEKELEDKKEAEEQKNKMSNLPNEYTDMKTLKGKLNKEMESFENYEKENSRNNTMAILSLNNCTYQFIQDWSNAFIAFCSEDYEKAEVDFQQLLINYSNELNFIDLSNIYRYLSVCYLLQNDIDKALSFAESAVLYNPNNYLAWNNKGVCLHEMNKKKEALRCYNISINIKGTDNAWYNKGSVLDDLNKKDDALIALDRCLEITRNYELALILKGCVLYSKDNTEQANEYFNKINPKRVLQEQLEEVKQVFTKYKLYDKYTDFLKKREE